MKLISRAEAAVIEVVSNEVRSRLVSNPHRGDGINIGTKEFCLRGSYNRPIAQDGQWAI